MEMCTGPIAGIAYMIYDETKLYFFVELLNTISDAGKNDPSPLPSGTNRINQFTLIMSSRH